LPTHKASLLSTCSEAAHLHVDRPCVQVNLVLCTLCTLCTPWRSGSRVAKSASHYVDTVSPSRCVVSRLSPSQHADHTIFQCFVKPEDDNIPIGPKVVEMLNISTAEKSRSHQGTGEFRKAGVWNPLQSSTQRRHVSATSSCSFDINYQQHQNLTTTDESMD